MTELIIGVLILLAAMAVILYFLKSVVWVLLKFSLVIVTIVAILYFIPIDWNNIFSEENLEPIKTFYAKIIAYINVKAS